MMALLHLVEDKRVENAYLKFHNILVKILGGAYNAQ